MSGIVLSADNKSLSLVPASFNDIMTLARTLASSSLIPSVLRNKPEDVAIILATGLEFGFSPFVSLRQIYVVEGKPALSADAQLAVVLRSPECEYFRLVDSTAQKATFETKRKGWPEPTRLTYTIEDARSAGLANKPNWKLNPLKMLQNRAKSTLAGAVYSDLLLGMPSIEEAGEEAGFERARDVTPRGEAQPASARSSPEQGSQVLSAIQGVSVNSTPDQPEPSTPAEASPPPTPSAEPVKAEAFEAEVDPDSDGRKEANGATQQLLMPHELTYEARSLLEEVRANANTAALQKWRKHRQSALALLDIPERDTVLAHYSKRMQELS